MKDYIFLFVSILAFSGCTRLPYLEAFNGFKGKPKIIETSTYRVVKKDSLAIEQLAYKNVFHFDRKGRIVRHMMYGADNTQKTGGWHYVYDKAGNMVQNTLYNMDSSVNVRNNYSYNKYGQQIFREYLSGKVRTITKTEYDRKRRTALVEGYTNDTTFHEKAVLTYDNKWRETELKTFKRSGKMERRIEKVYDQNGNLVLSRWFDSTNRLYEFYKSNFDDRKNRTSIEHYRVKGSDTTLVGTTVTEYKYDDKGNIVYEGMITNGVTTWVTRNRIHY